MVTSAMPQDVPPCGRVGCRSLDEHRHLDWEPGDRCVVEPKLATAPGWAYRCPRGTVVVGRHANVTTEVVTVSLDEGGGPVEVDWHLLTRQRTFDQRDRRRRTRPPTEKKRKQALDAELYDEPTLGDWLTDEIAGER